jgi:hypothetical protein
MDKYSAIPHPASLDLSAKISMPDFSLMENLQKQIQEKYVQERDKVIKDAFIRMGLDPDNNEFLKLNVTRVIVEDDPFEHLFLYYDTPEEQRIISIQRLPDLDWPQSPDGQWNQTISSKYY